MREIGKGMGMRVGRGSVIGIMKESIETEAEVPINIVDVVQKENIVVETEKEITTAKTRNIGIDTKDSDY